MEEKLKKYFQNKSLEELASLRGLVASIMGDYDKSLISYAEIHEDKFFRNMPDDVKVLHDKRTKMFTLLMCINGVIEDKLFKIYE
jgi:hypothetical protein